jgi:hypothetical protein
MRQYSDFKDYQWANAKDLVRQFKGQDYKNNQTFVIAVANKTILHTKLNCQAQTVPGFEKGSKEAVIVTSSSGHPELFISPRASDHRKMQLAFFDALGIDVPTVVLKQYQLDHGFSQISGRIKPSYRTGQGTTDPPACKLHLWRNAREVSQRSPRND